MATKNSSKSKGSSSKRLASFNKTQEIYKLLEKGIIESEALLSSAVDRPQDDAHVLDLLESASSAGSSGSKSKGRSAQSRSSTKRGGRLSRKSGRKR